jgi:hypothetical protein
MDARYWEQLCIMKAPKLKNIEIAYQQACGLLWHAGAVATIACTASLACLALLATSYKSKQRRWSIHGLLHRFASFFVHTTLAKHDRHAMGGILVGVAALTAVRRMWPPRLLARAIGQGLTARRVGEIVAAAARRALLTSCTVAAWRHRRCLGQNVAVMMLGAASMPQTRLRGAAGVAMTMTACLEPTARLGAMPGIALCRLHTTMCVKCVHHASSLQV